MGFLNRLHTESIWYILTPELSWVVRAVDSGTKGHKFDTRPVAPRGASIVKQLPNECVDHVLLWRTPNNQGNERKRPILICLWML